MVDGRPAMPDPSDQIVQPAHGLPVGTVDDGGGQPFKQDGIGLA